MTWMVSPRVTPQIYMERPWSYETSPNFDHTYDDIRNLWKRPGRRYDFMHNTFAPALGLEGMFGLGAVPVQANALVALTTLSQVRDYAARNLVTAQGLTTTNAAAESAKQSAIQQYANVVQWVSYDLANPPGGAWEPDEYTAKVADLKISLAYGDESLAKAQGQRYVPAQAAASSSTVTPQTAPVMPNTAAASDKVLKAVGITIAVAGVATIVFALSGRKKS